MKRLEITYISKSPISNLSVSSRLALRFILLSLILAVLLMGIAVVLNGRLQKLQQGAATPSLEMQLASMAMKLDANGLGSQVISGTQISVKLAPYPVQAGQVSALSVVAISPLGQLVMITPTLYVASNSPDIVDAKEFTLTHKNSGGYLAQVMLFDKPGAWQARIGFYLNATETSNVILLIEAQQ